MLRKYIYIYTESTNLIWTASSEFGTYRICEQRRFRRACASAQSRQNHRCSLIQAVSQEEPSDRKLDPWPLWMAGHAQLKFVMTECSKTQIRLTGLIWHYFSEYGFLDQDQNSGCCRILIVSSFCLNPKKLQIEKIHERYFTYLS